RHRRQDRNRDPPKRRPHRRKNPRRRRRRRERGRRRVSAEPPISGLPEIGSYEISGLPEIGKSMTAQVYDYPSRPEPTWGEFPARHGRPRHPALLRKVALSPATRMAPRVPTRG